MSSSLPQSPNSSTLLWYSPIHGYVQPDSVSGFGSLVDSDSDGEVNSSFVRIPFSERLNSLNAMEPDNDGDIYTDSLDPWKDLGCNDGKGNKEDKEENKKDQTVKALAVEKLTEQQEWSDDEGIDPVKYIIGINCPYYKKLPEYKIGCKPIYAFHRRSSLDLSLNRKDEVMKNKKI